MKKVLFVTILFILSLCSYSQEHIKFNGATFGKPVTEFIKGFPGSPSLSKDFRNPPKSFNSELCDMDFCYMELNSKTWNCYIFSSRSTKTVFRTVSVEFFNNDLETQTMLLVKNLEKKYGGGVQEPQENLGAVGGYGYNEYHKEMLALYYYIKGSSGNRIGEIRISVAPQYRNAKKGYIELSYTDYSSRDKATREYNSLMRNAL